MAASVREYETMQRELFGLVDRFVVLNETGRRMLVSNGSPAEKIVLNRLGVSHRRIAPKPGPDVRPTGTLRALRLCRPAARDQGTGGAGARRDRHPA